MNNYKNLFRKLVENISNKDIEILGCKDFRIKETLTNSNLYSEDIDFKYKGFIYDFWFCGIENKLVYFKDNIEVKF